MIRRYRVTLYQPSPGWGIADASRTVDLDAFDAADAVTQAQLRQPQKDGHGYVWRITNVEPLEAKDGNSKTP